MQEIIRIRIASPHQNKDEPTDACRTTGSKNRAGYAPPALEHHGNSPSSL